MMLLDPVTGDWPWEAGLVFATGIDAVVQAINARLYLSTEEWFLNLDSGIPYNEILGEKPTIARLREIFRSAILSAPDVTSLQSLVVTVANRGLAVAWTVITVAGLASGVLEIN